MTIAVHLGSLLNRAAQSGPGGGSFDETFGLRVIDELFEEGKGRAATFHDGDRDVIYGNPTVENA